MRTSRWLHSIVHSIGSLLSTERRACNEWRIEGERSSSGEQQAGRSGSSRGSSRHLVGSSRLIVDVCTRCAASPARRRIGPLESDQGRAQWVCSKQGFTLCCIHRCGWCFTVRIPSRSLGKGQLRNRSRPAQHRGGPSSSTVHSTVSTTQRRACSAPRSPSALRQFHTARSSDRSRLMVSARAADMQSHEDAPLPPLVARQLCDRCVAVLPRSAAAHCSALCSVDGRCAAVWSRVEEAPQ